MGALNEKKPTYAPAYMVGIYPQLAEEARRFGYALALHGSLQRDLDLIAVPWREDAAPAIDLVRALGEVFDVEPNHPIDRPEQKPHGRLGWSLPLWWGAYLDISVTPRIEPPTLIHAEAEETRAALRGEVKPEKCDGNHGGPRCADPECWNDPIDDVFDARVAAEQLIKRALAIGVVLTIETQPRQPLAMGNFDLVVETREVRKGGAA
ncbi:hypothetical protein [Methyloversatilis sp.]|uniref:hypothetical protein n=1 Tax=Methyloversatilis sp. TaxID=2569862 RepID=UPI003D28C294